MKITKYGHACVLIEDGGKRLLIDPGVFSFDDKTTPESVGAVDAIIVTHMHQDHFMPDILKAFQKLGAAPIIAGEEIKGLAAKEGLEVQVLPPGQDSSVAGFTLKPFAAPHERLPVPGPENIAYLVNGRLLHPGDSYKTEGMPTPEILALPTQSPWGTLVDTVEYATALKPKWAFPIHNSILKEQIGETFNGYIAQTLANAGIELKTLKVGESWEG